MFPRWNMERKQELNKKEVNRMKKRLIVIILAIFLVVTVFLLFGENVSSFFPPLVTRNQYIAPDEGDGTSITIIEVAKYAVGLDNESERITMSPLSLHLNQGRYLQNLTRHPI